MSKREEEIRTSLEEMNLHTRTKDERFKKINIYADLLRQDSPNFRTGLHFVVSYIHFPFHQIRNEYVLVIEKRKNKFALVKDKQYEKLLKEEDGKEQILEMEKMLYRERVRLLLLYPRIEEWIKNPNQK